MHQLGRDVGKGKAGRDVGDEGLAALLLQRIDCRNSAAGRANLTRKKINASLAPGEQMGWDFDDPMDRFMATLVLMVRRISLSAAALAEADSP